MRYFLWLKEETTKQSFYYIKIHITQHTIYAWKKVECSLSLLSSSNICDTLRLVLKLVIFANLTFAKKKWRGRRETEACKLQKETNRSFSWRKNIILRCYFPSSALRSREPPHFLRRLDFRGNFRGACCE